MRQIKILIVVAIVCISVWAFAKSSSNNEMQDKWEYSTVTIIGFPSLNKTMWICSPKNAIPDVNSVEEGLRDNPVITNALNVFGNYGWELIAMTKRTEKDTTMETFFFKRRK